jgi:hypothetical protein
LREALARSDLDFVIAEEPRRKPRAPKAAPKSATLARMRAASLPLAFLTRRPVRTIVGATATALVTGIILNAVMFQTGRHPAPLFGGPGMTTAAMKPATPPLPAPRPANVAQAAQVAPTPSPAPAPSTRASEPLAPAQRAAEPAPAAGKKDAIAALLKGEGIADPVLPPARVAAVQKALIKSGFILRADGVMGATTRQALERFEQERKLPVTGDLSPRTLRELAAQSGVAIP